MLYQVLARIFAPKIVTKHLDNKKILFHVVLLFLYFGLQDYAERISNPQEKLKH
jgi:hypothetical protein